MPHPGLIAPLKRERESEIEVIRCSRNTQHVSQNSTLDFELWTLDLILPSEHRHKNRRQRNHRADVRPARAKEPSARGGLRGGG